MKPSLLANARSTLKPYSKVIALLAAMVCGGLLPQFHALSFLIQYLLMAMLFFSFLDTDFRAGSLQKSVLLVLLANIAIAFGVYWLAARFDPLLALAAFMTAIAPTAISSPVIIGLIGRKVDYMVSSVLLTNVAMSLILPFVLPRIAGQVVRISIWQVLEPVLLVMFVPLLLALLTLRLPAGARTTIHRGRALSFPLWLVCLFIISANASDFLRNEMSHSAGDILGVGLTSLAICILNFSVGAWLGGREYWQEASQSLGQKNNSFVIWIAITFLNPLVALGPGFYILYHNLYNSWQIYRFERQRHP